MTSKVNAIEEWFNSKIFSFPFLSGSCSNFYKNFIIKKVLSPHKLEKLLSNPFSASFSRAGWSPTFERQRLPRTSNCEWRISVQVTTVLRLRTINFKTSFPPSPPPFPLSFSLSFNPLSVLFYPPPSPLFFLPYPLSLLPLLLFYTMKL